MLIDVLFLGLDIDQAATTTSNTLSTGNIIYITVASVLFVLLVCVVYCLMNKSDATAEELSPIQRSVESADQNTAQQNESSHAIDSIKSQSDPIQQISYCFRDQIIRLHTVKEPKPVSIISKNANCACSIFNTVIFFVLGLNDNFQRISLVDQQPCEGQEIRYQTEYFAACAPWKTDN